MHNQTFTFESDFVSSLRCIPMAVRRKLDQSRIKLSLRQWSRLAREARGELLDFPCGTSAEIAAFRSRIDCIVAPVGQGPLNVLSDDQALPDPPDDEPPRQVADFARAQGLRPIEPQAWRGLTDLERFALVKLSRDNHDNIDFVPALREFGLFAAMSTRRAV